MRVSILIDDEEKKILQKRAKKNLMTIREQIEDIVRRSCVNAKNKTTTTKVDDPLVAAFSRDSRGRKGK